ncbi:hypothetical protein FQA39_LY11790 [Lamprigera yunnana]|nr:hypothetical protein FQA39_LY11790 [Lamprigera yunnana]
MSSIKKPRHVSRGKAMVFTINNNGAILLADQNLESYETDIVVEVVDVSATGEDGDANEKHYDAGNDEEFNIESEENKDGDENENQSDENENESSEDETRSTRKRSRNSRKVNKAKREYLKQWVLRHFTRIIAGRRPLKW